MTVLLFAAASSLWANLMPPEFPAFVPKKTNHFHLTFAWDSVVGVTGYGVYQGWGIAGDFTNRVATSTNRCVISNLNYTAPHTFSVCSASNGVESDFSTFVYVPWPKTNFASLYAGANLVLVETNPPTPSFYRGQYFNESVDTVQVRAQRATNLYQWQTLSGLFLLTNKPANFKLKLAVTNNVDGYYGRD